MQVTTELRTLHGASHPHVVKYHQAFFDNGAITIVMEHMDGGSLADVLKLHNGLKEPYIAELARQVSRASNCLAFMYDFRKCKHRTAYGYVDCAT